MDLNKNKSGTEMGFHPPSVSSDCLRFGTSALLPDPSQIVVFHENQMSSSSSMCDSFFPTAILPHFPTNSSFVDLLTHNYDSLRVFSGSTSPSKLVSDHGSSRVIPSFDPQEKFFDEAASGSSSDELRQKRRRKTKQDMELREEQGGEAGKENTDAKKKIEVATKAAVGKQPKDSGSEASKGDYVHVRARRGQATNSHSLAERVRREKISQRMKLLQDLVPGCSKVTGKAIMLDEIINYVQSLQRQVEFLSMKLATVNPRLDFDAEALPSKDGKDGSSLVIGLSPEAIHNQFLQSQQVMGGSGRSKDPQQMICSWDEEFNNVLQVNFAAKQPLNS